MSNVPLDSPASNDDDVYAAPQRTRRAAGAGCLFAIGSALITCLMLFINGSLVMAILVAISRSGPSWLRNEEFQQFMLFAMPVVLAVIEWMMLDYVRTRLFPIRDE